MAQIDLIIPTINGREKSLERCVESFRTNTGPLDLNMIIVAESKPAARGSQQGLAT